jgi:hypothetical protein
MPRAQATAFIFSQFTNRGTVHYMGLPEQEYFGSQPEPSTCHQQEKTAIEVAKKYTFAVPDSCLEEVEQLNIGLLRDLWRPNQTC